ncbi:rhodanese-like domain-containing protein [Salinicoccus halitifaciens]|uniref:Rhodanese-related sulfurtransferase n=1 Tax=Salinicoccus halitifaciens TaxID=1073415 RepID=A0ABV2EAQ3_9STAP|nr:rhodanese-like domain-containing protein [Salinicoccus halitifaciens]MCD2138002.1 rhodanese-like domain-containing protein [Salinicoccus halitifaciens]
MDLITWILIAAIVVLIASRFMPAKGINNISVHDAKDKFNDKDVQFIDVRTPGEYKVNHRKPFRNIPLQSLSGKVDKLDKDKEVVVICQSGMRSTRASKMLRKMGFKKISNVRGGMSSWS